MAGAPSAADHPGAFEIEYAFTDTDGNKRWIVARGTPHYSEDGQFLGYQARPRTSRKARSTETIARNSAVLRATLENMDQASAWSTMI